MFHTYNVSYKLREGVLFLFLFLFVLLLFAFAFVFMLFDAENIEDAFENELFAAFTIEFVALEKDVLTLLKELDREDST
jgi:hypothetical protein